MTDTSPQNDGIALLLEQHEVIRRLLDQVEDSVGEARQEAFDNLRRLLAVHETAEELVVRPTTRTVLPDGRTVADARIEEENQSKDLLAQLENMGADDAGFLPLFGRLKELVLAHARQEEAEEFGPLRAREDATQLRALAVALRAAEAVAPTHPHPTARSTTANLVLGPYASVVDRVRDAIGSAIKSTAP